MYCHPSQVRKWAKAMKPKVTPVQIQQAALMRLAKQKKAAFLEAQYSLFPSGKKTANRMAPGSGSTFASPANF
jgi:hypothetical protein